MLMSVSRILVGFAWLAGSVVFLVGRVCAQTPPVAVEENGRTPVVVVGPESLGGADTMLGPFDALPSLRGDALPPSTGLGRNNAAALAPAATAPAPAATDDAEAAEIRELREFFRQFPLRRRAERERVRETEPEEGWFLQPLPDGRIFPSYLAGPREPRMAGEFVHDRRLGWLLNGTLGGRFGMVRFGDRDSLRPEGLQLDIEGAAFPRVALDEDRNLTSVDFRAGMPLGFRQGPLELKFAYYHYCSHLGDGWAEEHPGLVRTQYSRDALVWAVAVRPVEDLRVYAEADWAFHETGASRPWEFQLGVDYSPLFITGFRGAPFLAINAHLREDVDFSGLLTLQAGWQWRGDCGQILRTGLVYSNGMSDQAQFFSRFEEQIGMGLWFDF
jgi:hypothetical protein